MQTQITIDALKTLRDLPSVSRQQLVVGGPSVTNPVESSQGFHLALISFHPDRTALDDYQASKEHYE